MSKTYFTIDYFEFFIELALNNQKSWFDENRKTYEKVVRPQFLGFAADLRMEAQYELFFKGTPFTVK